jgi:glucose-1-phosphate adenylyltransferase
VLAIVLAGGSGGRLKPLTNGRAKPAVPFGGVFRLIDFALTNCLHSELRDVWVVEQYEPHGLNDHLANGRPWDLDRTEGGLQVLPPYQGEGEDGFAEGNADALKRQSKAIAAFEPDVVLTMSADHILRLDLRDVLEFHLGHGKALTMVTKELPGEDVSRYGVVGVEGQRVVRFDYKPEKPKGHTVATEVFAYDGLALLKALEKAGEGDYGEMLVPYFVERDEARAFRLKGYWRDVGTLSSYLQGHLDLVDGVFDLDDGPWPLRTRTLAREPARISGTLKEALVSPGARVEGKVVRSVVGHGATVEHGAEIEECVLLDGAVVAKGAKLRRCIVMEGGRVEGSEAGSLEEPRVIEG